MTTTKHETIALTIAQAAQVLNLSRDSIYRAIEDGRLRAVRPGRGTRRGKLLILRTTLLDWLKNLEGNP